MGLPFLSCDCEIYFRRKGVFKMLVESFVLLVVFAIVAMIVTAHYIHKYGEHHEHSTWGSE